MVEHLSGNMYRLEKGESVTGRITGGKLTFYGELIVRVHEFPDLEMLRIQGGDRSIEVDGLDFPAVVESQQTNK